jgi:TonB family protein
MPALPQRRRRPIVPAAVAVVVAAIGVGAYRLSMREEAAMARAEPPATLAKDAATEVADAADRGSRRKRPAAAPASSQNSKSTTSTSAQASTRSRPRPLAPRAAPTVAKPAGAQSSTRQGEAVAQAPAPVIAPPVHDVVETAPASVPSPTPIGPFFETKDVNESPRIAARVEPRVPEALRARSIHDVVIVRALVSQTGHPSRISLLRRSKAGPELDAIIVEAVNQWTFAPARKKGEAVSCWLNFGVQVGGAE